MFCELHRSFLGGPFCGCSRSPLLGDDDACAKNYYFLMLQFCPALFIWATDAAWRVWSSDLLLSQMRVPTIHELRIQLGVPLLNRASGVDILAGRMKGTKKAVKLFFFFFYFTFWAVFLSLCCRLVTNNG